MVIMWQTVSMIRHLGTDSSQRERERGHGYEICWLLLKQQNICNFKLQP